MIDCLLKTNSFDIDIRDFSEKTPLHYAALNGADEVDSSVLWTEVVLQSHFVNSKKKTGFETLTAQVFEFLVGNKADIDALDAVSSLKPL